MADKTIGSQKLEQAIGRLEEAAGRIKQNARPAAEMEKLVKDAAAFKAERDKLAADLKARDAEIVRLEKISAEAAQRVDAVLGDIKTVLGA